MRADMAQFCFNSPRELRYRRSRRNAMSAQQVNQITAIVALVLIVILFILVSMGRLPSLVAILLTLGIGLGVRVIRSTMIRR